MSLGTPVQLGIKSLCTRLLLTKPQTGSRSLARALAPRLERHRAPDALARGEEWCGLASTVFRREHSRFKLAKMSLVEADFRDPVSGRTTSTPVVEDLKYKALFRLVDALAPCGAGPAHEALHVLGDVFMASKAGPAKEPLPPMVGKQPIGADLLPVSHAYNASRTTVALAVYRRVTRCRNIGQFAIHRITHHYTWHKLKCCNEAAISCYRTWERY